MNSKLLRKIEKDLEITSNELLRYNFCQGMTAAHLDEKVPCPDCELDIYARSYEHIDNMLSFGDD
jgi:hypothetical protein